MRKNNDKKSNKILKLIFKIILAIIIIIIICIGAMYFYINNKLSKISQVEIKKEDPALELKNRFIYSLVFMLPLLS